MPAQNLTNEIKDRSAWSIVMGILTPALGVFLIVYPLATATITTVLLYGLCGIALAFFPIAGVVALTALLGTLLLIHAGVATVTAFQMRPVEGWGWFLFDAITSLLMGILIFAKWPSASVWAIGTLIGVSVLTSGIARIMIATKIRSGVTDVERSIHGTA